MNVLEGAPDAPALIDLHAGALTYEELDALVGRFVRGLLRRVPGPPGLLLVLTRSKRQACVALLGALRTGWTYLPLDAGAPLPHQLSVLPPGAAALLVADDPAAVTAAAGGRCDVMAFADLAAEAASVTPAVPDDPHPDAPAYVISTSGTTGARKGVCVSRRSLAAHLAAVAGRFGLSAADRVLHAAPLYVDVAIEQLLAALRTGGCVVLADAPLLAPPALTEVIGAHGVTVINLTAGHFHEIVADQRVLAAAAGGPLRLMIVGGDRLAAAAVARWHGSVHGVRLLNAYGPTEATITATTHDTGPGDTEPVPIGTAVGGRRLYVVDDRGEQCGTGVTGELWIGGEALAQGYLGAAALTAARFVADPFAADGSRAYRTGDLVRRRADGALEFVGRRDRLVKVRGHRVEPGEVEVALAACPQVRDCAVLAGDGRLTAYVTGGPGADAAVRAYAEARLARHLVPAVVQVDALPLTPAGKVDRAALRDLSNGPPPVPHGPAAAPGRSAVAEVLAGEWSDVLGVRGVRDTDNFIALGGDSLTAMRVAIRLAERHDLDVSPHEILQAETLRALAAGVDPGAAPQPVPVAGGSGTVPLGFGQRGMWFLEGAGPGGSVYAVPWVFRLTGPVDVGLLMDSLRLVVARHPVLGTVVRVVDGEPCLVHGGGVEVTVSEDSEDAAGAVSAEVGRGFDGGLFRARLVVGSGEVVMVVAFHHLVWDGLSMGVFERDLGAFYTSAELPVLTVGYDDFVRWQRGLWVGGQWDRGLEFWASELAGVSGSVGLPGDRVRPVVQSFVGERLGFVVPVGVVEGLRGLVVGEGVTVFMVLLAVFDVLVFRWCGERDVVVGSPVSVRPGSQFDGVMGFFVNTVVLRVGVDGGAGFRELLGVVRDVVLRCFEFRDVPFELVVDRVLAERPVGFSPLVQLVFGVQGEDPGPLRWGPVTVEREPLSPGTAKFDVTWMMYDRGAGGLRGEVEFNTDLFDRAAIQSMITAWLTILEAVVADPDRRLRDIPLDVGARPGLPAAVGGGVELAGIAGVEPLERVLQAVWSDLLGVAVDRADQDFFAAGGHSLMMVKLATRVVELLPVGLPLPEMFRMLFRCRTVAALAVALAQAAPHTDALLETARAVDALASGDDLVLLLRELDLDGGGSER